MLDPTIIEFFKDRKQNWLNKETKSGMTDEEIHDLQLKCDEKFSLENWLPEAAKRAGQISKSTHPCTFSHPSARKNKNGETSPIFIKAEFTANGFLLSGNVPVETDALGNAAALDVYKFLTLVMQDGKQLLDHIQNKTELANHLLAEAGGEDLEKLREGFLAMVNSPNEIITSSKIKQVYFPISNEAKEYHLLSILTNSGHLFELRKRLDLLRFSDETKSARDSRKNNHFSVGYQEIYNLTTIGYGGTKPQNISVLNNQNAGKAHLLSSLPPEINARIIRLPYHDFFGDVIYPKQIQNIFYKFHQILSTNYHNINIRKSLNYYIQDYVDHIILKMWQVRKMFSEQEHSRPESIPDYQKTWLFPERAQQRLDTQDWLNELISRVTHYFMTSYQRSVNESIALGDTEYLAFSKIIERNKEAFL